MKAKQPSKTATPDERLAFYIGQDDVTQVEQQLREGANPNVNTKNGIPLLVHAITRQCHAAAKALISHGADTNVSDLRGQTPLIASIQAGALEIVEQLLQKNTNIEQRDHKRYSPLHHAAIKGESKIVQILLEHGAEIEALGPLDVTPLLLATENGNKDVANILKKAGADPKARRIKNSKAGDGGLVEQSNLMHAAYSGSINKVRDLIRRGTDVNWVDQLGTSALMQAAQSGHAKLDVCRLLIDAGADTHLKDYQGNRALELAIEAGKLDCIEYLVQQTHWAKMSTLRDIN